MLTAAVWCSYWSETDQSARVTATFAPPPQVKCDQYWPTRGTDTYGLIQVTLLDTVELATYCVRTFALFKVRSFCPRLLPL